MAMDSKEKLSRIPKQVRLNRQTAKELEELEKKTGFTQSWMIRFGVEQAMPKLRKMAKELG